MIISNNEHLSYISKNNRSRKRKKKNSIHNSWSQKKATTFVSPLTIIVHLFQFQPYLSPQYIGSNPDLCYTILALTPLLSFLGYDPAILFLFN